MPLALVNHIRSSAKDPEAAENQFAVNAPGHRLRIEVSSSNFRRFERNLNTGGDNHDEAKGIVAHNRVPHSAAYPSEIRVSVMRRCEN